MVIDRLERAPLYAGLSAGIQMGLKWLQEADFESMPDGRYAIDGDNVYAIVQRYRTRGPEACRWEAHRRYIDIQYVAGGGEQIGWAPVEALQPDTPHDSERDLAFFTGHGAILPVPAGTFVILHPADAHRPCLALGAPSDVLKVVVKVLCEG